LIEVLFIELPILGILGNSEDLGETFGELGVFRAVEHSSVLKPMIAADLT
jgi:hypothetical protein